jgi:hypothetical protein
LPAPSSRSLVNWLYAGLSTILVTLHTMALALLAIVLHYTG